MTDRSSSDHLEDILDAAETDGNRVPTAVP
jgi:hypothetical protein